MNIIKRLLAGVALLTMTWSAAGQEIIEYIHTDALGSPVAVSDSAGNVIRRTVYEPYGATVGEGPTDAPGFTGHVTDSATGLTYMQQRYYDPAVGAFISSDPVTPHAAPVAMFNRYRYASNNPYRFYDPDGRCTGSRIKNGDGTCKSSGEFTTQASSATSAAARSVGSVFSHSSVSTMGGDAAPSDFPGETRSALSKFLGSEVGGAIGMHAVRSGRKIELEQILPSSGYPPAFSAGYAGTNIVTYSLEWRRHLASNSFGREFSGTGLDVLLAHEIGHTPIAGQALGYNPTTSSSDADEFNAVRYVENPYRRHLGVPLRTQYSGVAIPAPLIGGQ